MDMNQLDRRLKKAMRDIYIEQPPHAVPSPSGVEGCIRRQWATGKKIPVTNLPAESTMAKMEAGRAIEPYWRKVYRKAGFRVVAKKNRINIAGVMTGEVDMLIADDESDCLCPAHRGTTSCWDCSHDNCNPQELDEWAVVDLKHIGWYGYIKTMMLGVKEGEPGYYMQLQSYLLGLPNCTGAILHCSPQDYSAANRLWLAGFHSWKRQTENLPEFIVQFVPIDRESQYEAVNRAKEVEWLLNNVAVEDAEQVRREYDPHRDKFPCGYCPVQDWCKGVG